MLGGSLADYGRAWEVCARTGLIGPLLVETVAGTSCDTTGLPGARTLSQGQYPDDGTLSGSTGNGVIGSGGGPDVVGWYDGLRWRYHDLDPDAGSADSARTWRCWKVPTARPSAG